MFPCRVEENLIEQLMDKKIFEEVKGKVERYVGERRLRDAFALAHSLAAGVGDTAVARDVAAAEEGYRYMLEYAARGAEDPARGEMTRRFGSAVLDAIDRLDRENRKADTPTCYFSTLRYEELQAGDSVASLLDRYAKAASEASLFNYVVSGAHSDGFRRMLTDREALERRIFNRVWVTHPLGAADAEALQGALVSADLPVYFRELLVSALTLGGLEYFDEQRIMLLLDAYGSGSERLSVAAFTGLMLLLHSERRRGLSAKAKAKLDAFREGENWCRDLKSAYMELVKTIDTDRISRKIREEVVPEMLKLRPEIDKKLNLSIEKLDPAEMEDNPEWQDMLEKSGLADKLKEMSEIQEEGGDVMMGTFAHLKSFPFFNEPANWFLPFHADYSEFSGADAALMQPVAELIASAPFLCDSDKYSFMFSLAHVPAAQRDAMMEQFKAQGDQLARLQAASLTVAGSERRGLFNKLVQNIYRFYRLFRRKGEFRNPFAEGVNLVEAELLRDDILSLELLPLVAEFYFSHGYYSQALGAFDIIAANTVPDAQLYQKMGHAMQKTGNIARAAEMYGKAEMLDGRSDWTLRRMARCLMALNRPEEALTRLRVLEERHPGHAATALNIGRCLLETGRYDEAIGAYYKAEYLDEASGKALRPLAWCLLLTGDLPQSRRYYEKVMERTTPEPADYLNMGHLALAEGRFQEALNLYSLNISSRGGSVNDFIADMRADAPHLECAGVDSSLIPLLIDSLLYTL